MRNTRSEFDANQSFTRAADTRADRDAMIARIWGAPALQRAKQSKGQRLARETLRAIFKYGLK